MKLVHPVAYAFLLSLGASTMLATPVFAAKQKKEEQAAPKFSPTPEFAKAAAPIEAAIKAKDYATAETQLAIAGPLAKNDDDRFFVDTYRLQIASSKSDNAGVAQALDGLLANPKTPAESLPLYNNLRGSVAVDMKQPAQAIPYLLKARQLGFAGPDLSVSLAQAYGATGKVNEAIAEIDKAIAAQTAVGHVAPEAWYAYAVSNLFALRDVAGAEAWLVRQIAAYPKLATWRTAVSNYRKVVDPTGAKFTKAQKLDLFRMIRGTRALTDANDYYIYANAAQDSGFPWEAAAVIEEGRAAGRIPTSDADIARIYTSATAAMKAEGSAAAAAGKSKPSVAGDIYLAAGDYEKAAAMYATALAQPGVDVNIVNMHLGAALAHLGRKEEAKAAFAKVTAAPLADFAHLWTIWLDMPQLA